MLFIALAFIQRGLILAGLALWYGSDLWNSWTVKPAQRGKSCDGNAFRLLKSEAWASKLDKLAVFDQDSPSKPAYFRVPEFIVRSPSRVRYIGKWESFGVSVRILDFLRVCAIIEVWQEENIIP